MWMSMHVKIENTVVQQKLTKNSRMALCCQNQGYSITPGYKLHSIDSTSIHTASVTVAMVTFKLAI